MKLLVAEDDPLALRILQATLTRAGHEVTTASDGLEAWNALESEPFRLAIVDWMMPGIDGIDLCRRIRERTDASYVYLILLTSRDQKADVLAGLEAGADDYVTKPYEPAELRLRVQVGERVIGLEASLEQKVGELQAAFAHVRQLQGLIPICMFCKKIRDDSNTWQKLETYISTRSSAEFSHSLCEECLEKHYPGYGPTKKVPT